MAFSSKLKTTLEEISRDTWNLLRDSKSFRISFNEESLTNLLTIKFKRNEFSAITVNQTTHAEEAIRGNDLLIEGWLGPFEDYWARLAIQAKKLYYQSGQYEELHKSPKRSLSQLNNLQKYARTNKAVPVYLLYNYDDNPSSSYHWNCCSRPMRRKQLGCTITPALNIQHAIRQKKSCFDDIHRQSNTIPLRCLALCDANTLSKKLATQVEGLALPLDTTITWYKLPDLLAARNVDHLTREEMFNIRDASGSRLYAPEVQLPVFILVGDRSNQETMPDEERYGILQ